MDTRKRLKNLSPQECKRLGIFHPVNIDFTINEGYRSWEDQLRMEGIHRDPNDDYADALRFAFPETGKCADRPRTLRADEVEARFKEPPALPGRAKR